MWGGATLATRLILFAIVCVISYWASEQGKTKFVSTGGILGQILGCNDFLYILARSPPK